jgi:hypothetical protein
MFSRSRSGVAASGKVTASGFTPVIAAGAAIILSIIVMRLRGYRMGGNVVVRCRQGHLFTTIWVPGASLKAVRLGWGRFQWCPVGRHWSIVTPVKEADLTADERQFASEHRDIRVP